MSRDLKSCPRKPCHPGLLLPVLALIAFSSPLSWGAEQDEPPHWNLVVGRYQLIGRQPDNLRTYTGTARIERVSGKLRLTRKIAGVETQIFGVVRRADPGEAWVLSFQWKEPQAMDMVCLIGSDLDNYARLTCHWGKAGNPHKQPGMEAYFAQEPWDPVKP